MSLKTTITIDPNTQKNIDQWLNGDYDEKTKEKIRELLQSNPKELIDAFYTKLSFGTAGLRGIMGIGSNRMNQYTIMTATQALANYLATQPSTGQRHSVFIGYDSRHHSKFFAEQTAKVLAANNIHVYLCKNLRPTPLVSFGCRFKKCSAAIMITASHNPAEYNGYKVYWNDGGQVLPPHDKGIMTEFNAITDVSMIKAVKSLPDTLIESVEEEVDDAYLKSINELQLYRQENKLLGKTLRVVYTNLHGTGITLMPRALALWGFSNIVSVEQQEKPDGDFPTVHSPNPENREALKLGIETLQKVQGDILIATDPDADRVAVAFLHGGEVHLLNGNQIACICLEHICKALSAQGKLPEKAAFIKSVVTTELFRVIAEAYHKPCFDVLTGFKYIAEKIREWESDPNGYKYVFGGEESYGYLLGTQTRDKDAILSGVLLCEVALHAKRQGKTLMNMLEEIFKKYGTYVEKILSIDFEDSKEGKERMKQTMSKLRQSPPKILNGIAVTSIDDYLNSTPQSDMLIFWMADGSKLMIRPSGTEPKVKIYCGVVNKHMESIPEAIKEGTERAEKLLSVLKNWSLG